MLPFPPPCTLLKLNSAAAGVTPPPGVCFIVLGFQSRLHPGAEGSAGLSGAQAVGAGRFSVAASVSRFRCLRWAQPGSETERGLSVGKGSSCRWFLILNASPGLQKREPRPPGGAGAAHPTPSLRLLRSRKPQWRRVFLWEKQICTISQALANELRSSPRGSLLWPRGGLFCGCCSVRK